MRIRLFEDFTGSKVGKKGLLPFRVQSVIDQIEVYNIANKIYAVVIKDVKIRCYLFLRYQEYYEGASNSIRGSKFSIDNYINWYMDTYKNKDMFTYAYDWAGFNIPSNKIEECLESIYDRNEYDRIMSQIFNSCKYDSDLEDFYLLGVDSLDGGLLEHEMAHGMYFTDPSYKLEMDKLTESLPKEIREIMNSKISEMGYGENVISDEVQAYMSTGLMDEMEEIKGIKTWVKKYQKVFKKFLEKNKSPKEIKIEWE